MSKVENGIVQVIIDRSQPSEDVYGVEINNVRSGEILQAIVQLTSTLAAGTGEPLENLIGSIYQGCLTPEELVKLQENADKENEALAEFENATKKVADKYEGSNHGK